LKGSDWILLSQQTKPFEIFQVLEREWLDGGNLIRPKTKIFQDHKFCRKQFIFENWQIRRMENQAIQVRELFQDLFWDEVDFGRAIEMNNSCLGFLTKIST
jgi:hypothetical protein